MQRSARSSICMRPSRKPGPQPTRKTNARGVNARAYLDLHRAVHVVTVDKRGRNVSRTYWEEAP